MHIAFSGRLTPPITGSELVPIKILQQLVNWDITNQYSIFLSEENRDLLGFESDRLQVITYQNVWSSSIGSILWHQLVLPLAVIRYKIDVLWAVQNRIPLLKTCPQAVIVYDLADYRVANKYDRVRDIYRNLIFKRVVPRADRIVTISENSKRDIIKFLQVPKEKVDVIYCGVGDEFFLNLPKPSVKRYLAEHCGITEDYILYVGALEHPNKNLVRLLQAYVYARQNLGVTQALLLVGPKRYRPEVIFQEIERLDLQSIVKWLGFVSKEDLPYIYAGADLCVYVSLYEGFGLPVLEAMASGVPVIASNTSSLPEVVGDCGVLVDPLDMKEIAQAIGKLAQDKAKQRELGEIGIVRARQFSWKSSAEKLHQVFERVSRQSES
jgi:glycosyltransferase involved in cell wall biosynthesis